MKRRLVPAVLATALMVGVIGCNNNNNPPFVRLVLPATRPVTRVVSNPNEPVRLTTPGGLSEAGSFDITIPAGALASLINQFGPVEVSAKAVESITVLSAQEQTAINAGTFNGATLLAMVQIDVTPLAGGGALFTAGLRTKQAAQASQIAFVKVKHRGPRFCTPGAIQLIQVIGAEIFEPPNTTVSVGDISTDTRGRFQDISGESAGVRWLQHFIFCYECPRLKPTPSPTPIPSPTATPTVASGISGQSGSAGGSGTNGTTPVGGGGGGL